MSAERLSLLGAAWVVARRDFVAILWSRSFIFFLLGPLFPLLVGALAGGIGQRVESAAAAPQIPTPIGMTVCSVAAGPAHGPRWSSRPVGSTQ